MKLTRISLITAALAVATLLLAACGSDDPTPTSAPTATPEPPATPTATLAPGVPTPTPAPATPTPAATPTPSFDAAAYFKGKTIRIMANSNPGGGTDSQGRVMSAFISKWIPGNPRVVFSNNGNKPLEYIFSATEAPKDGTYISWNSTPQLNFGFEEDTNFIKRTSFQFIGATIDGTRAWMTFDPVGNLGAAAADKCLWDFAGQTGTGGGNHDAFYLADEISDVAEGAPGFVANAYASEQLGVPFKYFAFDTVDTNAIYTMWARGDINTTVRGSLWYRFPLEQPDWIPDGLMRVYAGMGPGELGPSGGVDAHCDNISSHFETDAQRETFEAIMNPPNYLSKALWLPPGTPDNIADALHDAFQEAFANDADLVAKYGAIAGEVPRWTDRATGTASTIANEAIFEESLAITKVEGDRLIEKYFPQYVSN
jgi:hypothetical protein